MAGTEFACSTEVRDWAAVTGLVIDVMREITFGLIGLSARQGADRVGVDGHHLVEFLRAAMNKPVLRMCCHPFRCLPGT